MCLLISFQKLLKREQRTEANDPTEQTRTKTGFMA